MSEPWRTVLYVNQFGSVVHAPGPGIELVPVMPVSEHETAMREMAQTGAEAAVDADVRRIEAEEELEHLRTVAQVFVYEIETKWVWSPDAHRKFDALRAALGQKERNGE